MSTDYAKALEALEDEICRIFGAMWSPSLDKLTGLLAKHGWEMSAEHNHPPSCCCPDPGPRTDYRPPTICPACPVHGTFACRCRSNLIPGTVDRDCSVHGQER